MLANLHPSLRILQIQRGVSEKEVSQMLSHFPQVPVEYLELVTEGVEIELEWGQRQYLRIWSPNGCLEMNEGYGFSKRIEGAIPIGDNGGGSALVYLNGTHGWGLYRVGFGDIDREDADWIAPSLTALLCQGQGLENCDY